jgi:DNA helicase-2/ATP-dependent DNA helicase PcrA
MSFTPSKYQEKIFDFIKNEKGNLLINAKAGSGKTTSIIHSLKYVDTDNLDVLFLAFNKSIKKEIDKRVKDNNLKVSVNTCHGYGYSLIMNHFDHTVSLDNGKYKKLLNDLINCSKLDDTAILSKYNFDESLTKNAKSFDLGWENQQDKHSFITNTITLVNLIRLYYITDLTNLNSIIDKYDIILTNDEISLAIDLLLMGQSINNIVDYTDMLYYPIYYDMEGYKYDYVYIDEVQDVSTIQRLLMLKAVKENGRYICVGDKFQSIYGFAGADDESFDKLLELPNMTVLPLSESYRCGKNIIESVKHIVSDIEAHHTNPDGVINKNASVNDIESGDMVLCRNTYPLVKLCLKFASEGKKANVMGTDIGKGIINLLESTNESDSIQAIAKLYKTLETTLERIIRKTGLKPESAKRKSEYGGLLEKINLIEIIYRGLPEDNNSVSHICSKINSIFRDSCDGILLSTVHKAKGLEASKVYIIHTELMPSPYAEKEWELKQEDNLIYVARTRAINELNFVMDYDAYQECDDDIKFDFSNVVIKESKHIGSVGERVKIAGEIVEIKHIPNYNTDVYVVEDNDGNILEHWGTIPHHFTESKNKKITVGTKIKGTIKIVKHTSFNNINKTSFKCLR